MVTNGILKGGGHPFTHDRTHTATQKTKIQDDEHRFTSSNATATRENSIVQTCFLLRISQALSIWVLVSEFQHVYRPDTRTNLFECHIIYQTKQSLLGRAQKVMPALIADRKLHVALGSFSQ